MSTPNPPPPPPAAHVAGPPPQLTDSSAASEIRIISHSNLFYWWPVWAVGVLMAVLTFFDGYHLAVVTPGSKARRDIQVVTAGGVGGAPVTETREGILLGDTGKLWPAKANEQGKYADPDQPHVWMSPRSTYGVIFCATLLLVIFITNVPLRGLWSVVVIVFIVMLLVIFALAGWWDAIFRTIGLLDIRINAGGYLFISGVLFVIWLFTTMFFDRQIYMIFTPGQGKVCQEIGGGETAFDTMGMTIEKHRDDLFRHWILGLGSGDLTVRTSGANPQTFNLHNVLFIGRKLQLIEDMQRDRPVVKG